MARIRSVHPDICQSETMAVLDPALERTFVRLWTHCDDEGRCEDRPRIIKAGIYPVHDEMTWQRIDAELTELHTAGLIVRYELNGKCYIAVRSWGEYQHPQRPRQSEYPTPPDESPPPPEPLAEPSWNGTRGVRERPSTNQGLELGEGEGEGEGAGARAATPGAALTLVSANDSPPLVADRRDLATGGYPVDFAAWWELYPRKVAKAAAARAWKRARGQATWDQLSGGLEASLRAWQTEHRKPEHIPHAAAWLNDRRWEDDHTAPPVPAREPKAYDSIRRALDRRGSA